MRTDQSDPLLPSGRLDEPPGPGDYLKLPDSFGRRFAIFVDTEEEFDWSKPLSRDERSTGSTRALPGAHRRLREWGAAPIYLVDHPIACDPECVAALREFQERGECAVGTQLHPWVNPPFEEEVNPRNSFTGNLPEPLERAKMKALTDTIEHAFGRRPISYRAGRYGVGPNSARLLADLGYRLDLSVRARFDYSDEDGPDFSGVRPFPFRVGDRGLFEIPLSAAYTGMLRRNGPRWFPATARSPLLRSLLGRARLLGRVALTPEGMPLREVLPAIDILLDEGVQLLSISFHSPSVEPGHTPYVRDAAGLREFYAWWDAVLGLLAKRGIRSASEAEMLAAVEAARPASASLANPDPAPLSRSDPWQGPVAQR